MKALTRGKELPQARRAAARKLLLCACGAALLAGSSPAGKARGQALYSWTDKDGAVHFSNTGVPPEQAGKAHMRFLRPPPSAAHRASPSEEIPLREVGGRKLVQVELEGPYARREVAMVVDTGAQITMIDEDLADDLRLEVEREANIVGVTGAAPGWIGRLRSLRVGDREVHNWPVMVGPQQGMLLLGMDVLSELRLSVERDRLGSK